MVNPRVLVVEDDADRALLTRKALDQAPAAPDVDVVEDGREALDHLADSSIQPPHLVLLDLQLPEVDGFAVLDELEESEELPDVPVVVLTSSDEREDMLESYRRGAHGFVTKPVDYDEFRSAVSGIARFWLEINRVPHDAG